MNIIGKRLESIRRNQNLSVKEVSDAIGISQNNIRNIENGIHFENETEIILRMGSYYGIVLDFLFNEELFPDTEVFSKMNDELYTALLLMKKMRIFEITNGQQRKRMFFEIREQCKKRFTDFE